MACGRHLDFLYTYSLQLKISRVSIHCDRGHCALDMVRTQPERYVGSAYATAMVTLDVDVLKETDSGGQTVCDFRECSRSGDSDMVSSAAFPLDSLNL